MRGAEAHVGAMARRQAGFEQDDRAGRGQAKQIAEGIGGGTGSTSAVTGEACGGGTVANIRLRHEWLPAHQSATE